MAEFVDDARMEGLVNPFKKDYLIGRFNNGMELFQLKHLILRVYYFSPCSIITIYNNKIFCLFFIHSFFN